MQGLSHCVILTVLLVALVRSAPSTAEGAGRQLLSHCSLPGWSHGQSTFVLTCVPLRGHLTPLLYVAQELSSRGHNVLLAVPTKAMEWVPWGQLYGSVHVHELVGPTEEVAEEGGSGLLPMLARAFRKNFLLSESFQQPYEPLLEALEQLGTCGYAPDMLFVDFISHFAFDAADTLGLPSVASVPMVGAYQHNAMLLPSPSSGFQLEMSVFERVISFMMAQVKPILHIPMAVQMNQRRKRLGLRSQHSVEQYLESRLQLCFTVVGFEYAQLEPPAILHVGPAQVSRESGRGLTAFNAVVPPLRHEVVAWLDEQLQHGRRVLYVSAGSTKLLTAPVVSVIDDAMRTLLMQDRCDSGPVNEPPCRPEISVLYNMDEELFFPNGHWSDSLTALRGRVLFAKEVEQPRVLSHNAVILFLSHCGLNSVNEAMLATVPLVCVPHRFDQLDNAARVVDGGLGRALPLGGLQAPLLSATVTDVLENLAEHRENARRLRAIALSHGGSSAAADALETALLVGHEHLMLNAVQRQPWTTQLLPSLVLLLMAWAMFRLFRSVFRAGRGSAPGGIPRPKKE